MKIVVNGTTVHVPDGSNVSVVDGKVIVNDREQADATFANDLKIEVIGGLISLRVERGNVIVQGKVEGDIDAGGDIEIQGSVGGKADAGGNITCGEVQGNVDAGGNVVCGKVSGDVDAGGNIMGLR